LPVLQILPLFVLMEALARPYVSKFQGMDMPKIIRNRVLLMMIINIILNLILIPRDIRSIGIKLVGLGTEGAAIATVSSYIFGLVYIRVKAWKVSAMRGNPRIVLHVVASMVMGLILWYLLRLTIISRWYHLIIMAMVGIAIYFAILYMFKEFRKKDFNFFMNTLNIKKLLSYIGEEIRGK